MADSLPQIVLPSGQWIDLYAETGITVGTQIIVQNVGNANARLTESATEPEYINGSVKGYNRIIPSQYLTSATTPVGAWAYAHRGTRLQVEPVS
jgi:hypothetical protein